MYMMHICFSLSLSLLLLLLPSQLLAGRSLLGTQILLKVCPCQKGVFPVLRAFLGVQAPPVCLCKAPRDNSIVNSSL